MFCWVFCFVFKVHFPIKTHKKGRFPSDQFSKFVAYSLEREYKFNICNPIVFMFDMTDAGLSNTVKLLNSLHSFFLLKINCLFLKGHGFYKVPCQFIENLLSWFNW